MALPVLQMRKPRQKVFSLFCSPSVAGGPLSTHGADPQSSFSAGRVLLSHSGALQSAVGLIIKQGDLMRPAEPDRADA